MRKVIRPQKGRTVIKIIATADGNFTAKPSVDMPADQYESIMVNLALKIIGQNGEMRGYLKAKEELETESKVVGPDGRTMKLLKSEDA